MNLKLRRPLLGILGVAVASGAILGATSIVGSPKTRSFDAETIRRAISSEGTTVSADRFTAVDGSLDSVVSYDSEKGGGTTAPALNDGEIRIYQGSNGNAGGFIKITVLDGYKLTSVTIGSSMSTTIGYRLDDASTDTKKDIPLAEGGTYSVEGISAKSITFICYGSSKTTRLYVNYLSATYVSETPVPDDEKATELTLSKGEGSGIVYQGGELDTTGYEINLIHTSESDPDYSRALPVSNDDERLTWNYDSSTLGTTDLTVTYTDGDIVLTSNVLELSVQEPPRDITYYFGQSEDYLNLWENPYSSKTIDYPGEFSITWDDVSKQSSGQSIDDMPVSKGTKATLEAEKNIESVTFGFKQWTTKTQTVTLRVNNTNVDKIDFPQDGTEVTYTSDTPFTSAVVTTGNASNQIGWDYVRIVWAVEDTDNGSEQFAEFFMGEELCDGGVTAPDQETWKVLADLYETEVSEEGKSAFAAAVANENGTIVEQCVARYDYIVGKYGSDVYQDFMGRSPEPLNYGLSINKQMSEEGPAWICALTLLAATLVLGGTFIARRRKESR